MDRRPSPLMRTLTACLLGLLGFGAGCKAKIDENRSHLMTTVRVSLSTKGSEGNAEVGVLERPDISDDGRFVVFSSKATNLVPDVIDTNNGSDVFLRDNKLRTTVLVSQTPTNTLKVQAGRGISTQPSISGDGRWVAFTSTADDLSPEDPPNDPVQDIFVRDMASPTVRILLVSRSTGPNQPVPNAGHANANSTNPRISKNGRYVAFDSGATNLHPDDALSDKDIYRRDIDDPGGQFPTLLISRTTGVPAGNTGVKGAGGDSTRPAISRDGTRVAFQSPCQNLVPNNNDGGPKGSTNTDIFVCSVLNPLTGGNRTFRVSVASVGVSIDPNGPSESCDISGDGNWVVWRSLAFNLNVADDGGTSDVFLRDISDLSTYLSKTQDIVSVHSSGAQAGAGCDHPTLTHDGGIVVWDSPSTNLVNGDANNVRDIFLRDRVQQTTTRISVATFGGELNAQSQQPAITRDGVYVVFNSQATNGADDDQNGATDIFMRGPPFN